jgi:hypothetical protein
MLFLEYIAVMKEIKDINAIRRALKRSTRYSIPQGGAQPPR